MSAETKFAALEKISRLPLEERIAVASAIVKAGVLNDLISPDWQKMATAYQGHLQNHYPNCHSMLNEKFFVMKRVYRNSSKINSLLMKLQDKEITESVFWQEMEVHHLSRGKFTIAFIQSCLDELEEDAILEQENRLGDMLLFFQQPARARAHLGSHTLTTMLNEYLLIDQKMVARGKGSIKAGTQIHGKIALQSNQFILLRSTRTNDVIFLSVWDINPEHEIPLREWEIIKIPL